MIVIVKLRVIKEKGCKSSKANSVGENVPSGRYVNCKS